MKELLYTNLKTRSKYCSVEVVLVSRTASDVLYVFILKDYVTDECMIVPVKEYELDTFKAMIVSKCPYDGSITLFGANNPCVYTPYGFHKHNLWLLSKSHGGAGHFKFELFKTL